MQEETSFENPKPLYFSERRVSDFLYAGYEYVYKRRMSLNELFNTVFSQEQEKEMQDTLSSIACSGDTSALEDEILRYSTDVLTQFLEIRFEDEFSFSRVYDVQELESYFAAEVDPNRVSVQDDGLVVLERPKSAPLQFYSYLLGPHLLHFSTSYKNGRTCPIRKKMNEFFPSSFTVGLFLTGKFQKPVQPNAMDARYFSMHFPFQADIDARVKPFL